MKEIWFPYGVWRYICSYIFLSPIWKYPYNKVMKELPKYTKKKYTVHLIKKYATKKIRFKKHVSYHHFIGRNIQHIGGFFDPISYSKIITYEMYKEEE